jgi:hypothetical protein
MQATRLTASCSSGVEGSGLKKEMVARDGIEPPTRGFSGRQPLKPLPGPASK